MQQSGKTRTTRKRKHVALRHAIAVGLWAFALGFPLAVLSQTLLSSLPSLAVSITVLLLVIALGVVFDVIGVAITAADESPLHARAAAGVFGAKRAATLVRDAHRVASFCNDVVGDVTGTLSGAIGIAIVFPLFTNASPAVALTASAGMSAAIAALIVGGKAYGKVFAIHHSTEITFQVGRLIESIRGGGKASRRRNQRRSG